MGRTNRLGVLLVAWVAGVLIGLTVGVQANYVDKLQQHRRNELLCWEAAVTAYPSYDGEAPLLNVLPACEHVDEARKQDMRRVMAAFVEKAADRMANP
jgi:hypothetical protein